jgi:hypothetical protein
MKFNEFINNKKVIIGQKDIQKSNALIKMSNKNMKFLLTLPINDSSSSTIFTSLYEALRQILEAIALKKGFKVYSHEAYTSYLEELNEYSISQKFDRYRKLRNGANYYGKSIPIEVTKNVKEEILRIRKKLIEKYLK